MVQPQCNSIMVALQQRRWPYKRSGGDLLVPVRSAMIWSCCGGSRKHLWALDRKLGCAPTSRSPAKELPERVWKGAVRPRSCSRGPTTTMAVDPGSRRRRLTTKTPTARRMGTPTPQHDGAMAAPTPRRMGTTTQQHDAARRKPRIESSIYIYNTSFDV